jgi:tRNA pseudouridine38-40 synthase
MHRYALLIDYHGGPFCGWQRQSGSVPGMAPSVQGSIEDALARLTPGSYVVTGAGRTDAGVHATGQVAHVDLARDWDPARLMGAINAHLRPLPIAILQVARVADDFHARFDARERRYLFRLVARRAPATHQAGLVWQVPHRLDLVAMQAGAAQLTGKHDFTTFRSTWCQAQSPVKTLDEVSITEAPVAGGVEYRFVLRARSFLHNQVRSIVGTLEKVGAGSWSPDDVRRALLARDRAACGPVCPPHGLYLTGVGYPADPFANR